MNQSTLSIDWEDFGQLFGMYHFDKITAPVGGAIERQTSIILDLLDESGKKATFFILGMLAQYKPELVKKIAAKGHEVALHGMNHKAMFTLSPEKAREDIISSMDLISGITGSRVLGYRAPFFSIKKENLYLLEMLAELDFIYDSSIFPLDMKWYGIDGFHGKDSLYDLPGGKQIVELPLTVAEYLGKKWPVSGGGYVRLMPGSLVKKVFRDFEKDNIDSMIYMHPYEFDTHPIDVSTNYPEGANYSRLKVVALNLRWNIFRNSVTGKIKELLMRHNFVTCIEKANYVKKMETVQSYWDARSELFGNYYKKPSSFDRVFRKGVYDRQAITVKACREIPHATVLDIGSGPGINSVSLIRNANAAHVLGIDFAEHMINYARQTAKEEGVEDKCTFVLGDIFNYDFGDVKFDFSCALGVFDYVEDAAGLVKRMNELSRHSFSASWPENGIRMALRRYRYTCPLFHYNEKKIIELHREAGISPNKLNVFRMGGGWTSVAHK